jgi:hypothetical protein
MASQRRLDPCPECGKMIPRTAPRCEYCGCEFEYDDEPPPRRDQDSPASLLVPLNVSGWALASCYLGLVGFCMPLAGLVFAVPAIVCGILALRRRKRATSYGAITGNIRAVIGLVLGALGLLIWGTVLVLMIVNGSFKYFR